MNSTAHFWLPTAELSPTEWLERHQSARQSFWGPRDTRIPAYLPNLVKEVCSLRSSLELLCWSHPSRSEKLRQFCRDLLHTNATGNQNAELQALAHLVENCLARVDWRELDILEMILGCLKDLASPITDTAVLGPDSEVLLEEFEALGRLRQEQRPAYERAVRGLISEARAGFMGLNWAFQHLRNCPERRPRLDKEALGLLINVLRLVLGLQPDAPDAVAMALDASASVWAGMHGEAQNRWRQQGLTVPLKPFEKASLYLLEGLPLENAGHAGFVRYVCEHDDAYCRLLAGCYAAPVLQVKRLLEEVERYNRLPENAARKVCYDDEEQRVFMAALLLRPDAVAAIVDRERHKDIYLVISGLRPKAYLPRTLHEVQNVFGYVTPEAFQQVVTCLQLDPVDVIRVIASYKQYSADPGGDIIIYVCKGTACFLRGQPELSRRLSAEIRADEGEVGRHGIQYIEMDCFGVCHLAPVVKTQETFLGKQRADDIPYLLEQLRKGPSYENRVMFLDRIRRMLAPGHRSEPLEDMRIVEVIEDGPGRQLLPNVSGQTLAIDAAGQVYARDNGSSQSLGRMHPEALAFSYSTPDGHTCWGGVILDEAKQLKATVSYPAPHLHMDLTSTVKPQAFVDQGGVWVERIDGAMRLGTYNANAVIIEVEGGGYRLVRLSGAPSQTLPEKERGLAAGGAVGSGSDQADFMRRQDRLVLGFAAETDPDEIQSYLDQGGYEAV